MEHCYRQLTLGEIVSDDIARIERFVLSLVRRERLLLLLTVAGRTALLLLAVALAILVLPLLRVERGAAMLLVVLAAGIGGWFAVALPILRGWRAAGDPVAQAGRVEALRPGLRGRLLTAVDHLATPGGAKPG